MSDRFGRKRVDRRSAASAPGSGASCTSSCWAPAWSTMIFFAMLDRRLDAGSAVRTAGRAHLGGVSRVAAVHRVRARLPPGGDHRGRPRAGDCDLSVQPVPDADAIAAFGLATTMISLMALMTPEDSRRRGSRVMGGTGSSPASGPCNEVRLERREIGPRPVQNRIVGDGCRPGLERLSAGGHLVEHGAEGEEIGPRIDGFPARLLGRHGTPPCRRPRRRPTVGPSWPGSRARRVSPLSPDRSPGSSRGHASSRKCWVGYDLRLNTLIAVSCSSIRPASRSTSRMNSVLPNRSCRCRWECWRAAASARHSAARRRAAPGGSRGRQVD